LIYLQTALETALLENPQITKTPEALFAGDFIAFIPSDYQETMFYVFDEKL